MNNSTVTTLIAHPGATSLLYPLVAALQSLKGESDFHTGLYFDLNGGLGRWLRTLPAAARVRLTRALSRRHHPEIDARRVQRHRLGEIVYLLSRKIGSGERALHWRNERFDRAVARAIGRTKPRTFIGFDGSSLHSIRQAKRVGTRSILFQAIGHIDAGIEMLRREREKFPAFFAERMAIPPLAWLDRQRAEALEADIVAVGSDYVARTMIERGTAAERIRKLTYPCDIERFRPAPPRETAGPLRALFVGAIGARKGIPYLLDAAAPLIRSKAMTLDLVGPLDCPAGALAPWQGLFSHRQGFTHHEMAAVYQRADIFVLPSLHEGQAMVCNEALASGLPIVCTENAGSTITDGIEGLIVPPADSIALRQALERLVAEAALRQSMGRAARQHAEAHNRRQFTADLGKLLAFPAN